MDATSTMLKVAYLKGLEKAAERHAHELGLEVDMVKEALLGALAKGALKWGVGKPLQYMVGKPLMAAGRAIGRQAARTGNAIGRGVARGATKTVMPGVGKMLYTPAVRAAPAEGAAATGLRKWLGVAPKGKVTQAARGLLPGIGRFGKNIVGAGTKSPETMSKAFSALTFGGRNVPAEMLRYGTITGAIGGLTGGQPGEGWSWSGAGKGFLGGAAGGLGWAAGSRLVRGGIGKMLGSKAIVPGGRLAGLASRANQVSGIGTKAPSFWGQRVYDAQKAGKSFGEILKTTPTGGAGQSVLGGLGSKLKDVGIKAGIGTAAGVGALGASTGAEEGARHLMGDEQSATSPESMAARGAYAMTPQGRRAIGYY